MSAINSATAQNLSNISLAFLLLTSLRINGKASATRPEFQDVPTAATGTDTATGTALHVERHAVDALLQVNASHRLSASKKLNAAMLSIKKAMLKLNAAMLQRALKTKGHSTSNGPYPAGWFGDFSVGESTYTYDGLFANRNENPTINVLDGWNPQEKNPFVDQVVPPQWFEESASGGYKEAWQTFYPAVSTGIAGNRVQTGDWYTGTGGIWQQNYRSPHSISQTGLPAGWFDDSVNQIDGFGRQKFPALGSPRNFIYWEERSVNTTLTCESPGCTANVSLQAPFDMSTEVFKDCVLSVMFHPTDFDDQYSGEAVQWVQVNNMEVSSNCHPFSSGCNQSASRPLLPCVDAVPLDLLMPKNGILHVSAKIAEVVDECPYNGNLLSAVPMLTCLVASKPSAPQGEVAPVKPSNLVEVMDTCVTTVPLQCPTRGCAAEIAIPISSTCGDLGQCMLSITVNQTDYDNKDGTPELIEYIKVAGKQAASQLKPGQNPCKSKWEGMLVQPSELAYTALKDYDVTAHVKRGGFRVEAKISQYVDECASNGYLLDATAKVTCSPVGAPSPASLLSQKLDGSAGVSSHQLRGHRPRPAEAPQHG